MGRKGVIFGGFGREKRVRRAYLGLRKPGKGRFFACRRGGWLAQRGFRARIGHYVSASARPKSTPRSLRRVRKLRVRASGVHDLIRSFPHKLRGESNSRYLSCFAENSRVLEQAVQRYDGGVPN